MPGTPTKKMKQSRLPFQALWGSAQKRKATSDQEPVCKQPRPDQPNPAQATFRPFELKEGMTLAPAVPACAKDRFDRLLLDQLLQSECNADTSPSLQGRQWHRHIRAPRTAPRAKLLQFCENVRPAYWGTWRKRSNLVSGRRPWAKDQALDYEVDSEAEWDEEPGESLSGSEPESEPDDYEVDNEVFVPHGYLSEDEEEGGGPSAAALQVRQLELQDELRENAKAPRLQPLVVVTGHDNGLLARFAAVRLRPGPLHPSWKEDCLPDDALQLLGRLVHGRLCCSQGELVRQFQTKWEGAPVARRQLLDALQSLGPERPRGGNRWCLPPPSLQRLGMPLSRPSGPLDRLWSREAGNPATPVESRQ
ncbi:hypothetical protein V5799_027569 [Amblyomma americanum]|uniref:Chromatin assembly factor 1 subunit A dimerization domain-containing protein n=1 Tax=Amblyomma americanum TaxID=6943 RepID=A0AAQ4DFC7_AMBAM